MTIQKQLLLLLSQKKDIFLDVEAISDELCVLPLEELVEQTNKRGLLLEQITDIDQQIRLICNGNQSLLDALNHVSSKDGLTPELAKLYDSSLAVKAVVNRILKNEESIRMYLDFEKQRITENMQSLNHSGTSVAQQYYQSVQTGVKRPLGGGNDKII